MPKNVNELYEIFIITLATLNTPVIQLAFKLGKKLDCKIPFRNNS